MDRAPKKPPFAVGTRLRYLGRDRSWAEVDGKHISIIEPGMEVVVEEVDAGRRGTLRQLRDADGPMTWEDTGDPILDETRDGYSVYHLRLPEPYGDQGRCILQETAKDWEVVE